MSPVFGGTPDVISKMGHQICNLKYQQDEISAGGATTRSATQNMLKIDFHKYMHLIKDSPNESEKIIRTVQHWATCARTHLENLNVECGQIEFLC